MQLLERFEDALGKALIEPDPVVPHLEDVVWPVARAANLYGRSLRSEFKSVVQQLREHFLEGFGQQYLSNFFFH